MVASSRISGFYSLSPAERQRLVAERSARSPEQVESILALLGAPGGLTLDDADRMAENVIGAYALPLGIATNFVVNGRDMLVPMVIEEPSVIAGASHAARLARRGGGFHAETTEPLMIGQIQVLDVADIDAAAARIDAHRQQLIDVANSIDPVVVSLHGGARDVRMRSIPTSPAGPMLLVELIYDCRDAMGANMVNTACETLGPLVEEITGGRVNLRILSNLADRRLARARCVVPVSELRTGQMTGDRAARRIVEAYALAEVDPYRAATHNKGIMNGIDAVVVATGNDWRAVEAGAHAYAARDGVYRSLSTWSLSPGDPGAGAEPALVGSLELPMAVGIVGGATGAHPLARLALALIGAQTARELAEVIASVGLAQNLAALRALATEGIQRGHMALHARHAQSGAGNAWADVA